MTTDIQQSTNKRGNGTFFTRFLAKAVVGATILEVVLFLATAGALSYLAETSQWVLFVLVLAVATALVAALAILRSKKVLGWLRERAAREQELRLRLDKYGVADVFNMQISTQKEERNRLTREMLARGSRFKLMSLTASSYIDPAMHRHWDSLKSKLEDQAPFRLLLQDPFCEEKRLRDHLNGIAVAPDPKVRLDLVFGLCATYPNFEVRFSSRNIYCALFLNERELIYDPYHLGRRAERLENYFLTFHFERKEGVGGVDYFTLLRSHFDNLWEQALSAEEFWGTNESLLNRLKVPRIGNVALNRTVGSVR